jgi:hypothetical protein
VQQREQQFLRPGRFQLVEHRLVECQRHEQLNRLAERQLVGDRGGRRQLLK